MTETEIEFHPFDSLAQWMLKAGQNTYIGEEVSLIQHMLQAADYARRHQYSDDLILAALFHDIGHMCTSLPQMNVDTDTKSLGTVAHEHVAADILQICGCDSRVVELVRHHVDAKRYLCATRPVYHSMLSEASRKTLELQGGPMNIYESLEFRQHPLFSKMIELRHIEDSAKVPGKFEQVQDTDIFKYKIFWDRLL